MCICIYLYIINLQGNHAKKPVEEVNPNPGQQTGRRLEVPPGSGVGQLRTCIPGTEEGDHGVSLKQ